MCLRKVTLSSADKTIVINRQIIKQIINVSRVYNIFDMEVSEIVYRSRFHSVDARLKTLRGVGAYEDRPTDTLYINLSH